jgi:hypothetical protein
MKHIIKNKRTGFLYLGIVLVSTIWLGFFMQSCSNESDHFLDVTAVDSKENSNMIASKYLEIIDNRFVLNLSEKEAIVLGISKSEYNRIKTEIIEANAFIIEWQNQNPGVKIEQNDTKNEEVNIGKIRLKGGTENNNNNNNIVGSFKMSADGIGGAGSTSIFVPSGVTKVKIESYIPCLSGAISGTVRCGGQSIAYSAIGAYGASTTVNLPVSNTNITITGITPCTGGGKVSISFIY